MKIHLWPLLTLRILFKGWRVRFVTILCLYCILKFHVLQLYMHHVQWSVAMMHYFGCDFSLWPICAFPTTTNTHTFIMLPTFTGLAILWVTENICIKCFAAKHLCLWCLWSIAVLLKTKVKNLRFQLQLAFEKNCPNAQFFEFWVFSPWNYICLFHSLSLKGKSQLS